MSSVKNKEILQHIVHENETLSPNTISVLLALYGKYDSDDFKLDSNIYNAPAFNQECALVHLNLVTISHHRLILTKLGKKYMYNTIGFGGYFMKLRKRYKMMLFYMMSSIVAEVLISMLGCIFMNTFLYPIIILLIMTIFAIPIIMSSIALSSAGDKIFNLKQKFTTYGLLHFIKENHPENYSTKKIIVMDDL